MHGKWGRSLLAVLLAGAALLGLAGCHRDTPLGKSFRFPLSAEPRQLDPQVSTDAASVTLVAALFEGLARLNENGEAVPAAADWTVSDDGRVYTFRLKESYWSTLPKAKKGETPTVWEQPVKVTAADFVFGMQRAVMPETGSALAAQLFGIQNAQAVSEGKKAAEELGVKAVDEDTLTITLTEADAGFPVKLAGTPFMPCNREFFEYTAGRYGLEKAYVLTNGPFSLGAWNHGQSLLLNKNEQYHEAEDVYPATVRYVIQPEAETGEALLAGTLDAAALRPDQLEAAREQAFHLEVMDDTIEYVWLNNSVTALSNASIRRALRDALAYDRIAEQLDKTICTPAQGYIAPDAILKGTEPYRNADNSRAVTTDRDKARRELSEGMAALSLTGAQGAVRRRRLQHQPRAVCHPVLAEPSDAVFHPGSGARRPAARPPPGGKLSDSHRRPDGGVPVRHGRAGGLPVRRAGREPGQVQQRTVRRAVQKAVGGRREPGGRGRAGKAAGGGMPLHPAGFSETDHRHPREKQRHHPAPL